MTIDMLSRTAARKSNGAPQLEAAETLVVGFGRNVWQVEPVQQTQKPRLLTGRLANARVDHRTSALPGLNPDFSVYHHLARGRVVVQYMRNDCRIAGVTVTTAYYCGSVPR